MSSSKDKDPLSLSELHPNVIQEVIDSKKKKPSELELSKESRLREKEQRLRDKEKNAAAHFHESESVKPTPPNPSLILDKIAAYRERFPELRSRNAKLSAKSTYEELEDELHYLELQLGTSKDSNLGCMLFIGSMMGIESLTEIYNPLQLNLKGLGKIAKDNVNEFSPILDELTIKYGAGLYVQPEIRLVVAVGALIMTVHTANNGDSRLGDAMKRMSKPVKAPPGSDKL